MPGKSQDSERLYPFLCLDLDVPCVACSAIPWKSVVLERYARSKMLQNDGERQNRKEIGFSYILEAFRFTESIQSVKSEL